MEKNVKLSILCQIYGKLLTQKQYDLLDNYYNDDLSLSEIADNNGITRQAVRDNIKKGENKLFEFESKLHLMTTYLEQEKKIKSLINDLSKVEKNISNKEDKDTLEKIKKELTTLVLY